MVVGEVAVGASTAGAGEWAVELVEYEEGAVELGGDEEEREGEVVGGEEQLYTPRSSMRAVEPQ